MNKKNIIIYVSSRNNYDMLEGEVLKNIDFEGFEFINVDDGSCKEEVDKGKKICQKNDIVFLHNKSRGVQFSTQTLIDFINENRKECKWIICFQHDNYPLTKNFFNRIDDLIKNGSIDEFGALGFNLLDINKYTRNSYKEWKAGKKPLGLLGIDVFSSSAQRYLCHKRNRIALDNPKEWSKPFIIEFPVWAVAGINVKKWNNFVSPSLDYEFHLWFPDVMMQLNCANSPCLILTDLYCMNNQQLKQKYGIPKNSAKGAIRGNSYYFGSYGPHLKNFKKRWGWAYEIGRSSLEENLERYKGTLIEEYYKNDIFKSCKPLRTIDV